MKNVLILGNGFDLDLGLPTRYSDFAKSNYWPKVDKVPDGRSMFSIIDNKEYHALPFSLDKKQKTANWFDLEEALLDYASVEVASLAKDLYSAKNDIKYYHELQSRLCSYLADVQNNTPIDTKSTACKVLEAIVDNGYFNNIYSFNYTDLNYLAKKLGIKNNITYTHLHGKLSDKSIILGINETKISDEYDELHKSSSEFYHSNSLAQALDEANEVVFYGFSFGLIDYDYFAPFFNSLIGKVIPEKEKKYISIFTKDINSGKAIIRKLRDKEINQLQLRSNAHLTLYYSDSANNEELREFYKRLHDTSRASHNRIMQGIASQLQ